MGVKQRVKEEERSNYLDYQGSEEEIIGEGEKVMPLQVLEGPCLFI